VGDTTLGLHYTDPVQGPSNITVTNSLWYLGIYLDCHLSWDNHISIMANHARSTIHGITILGNTQCSLDLLNWRKVYNALVIPVLTYGAQVWYTGHNQKGLVHKLQVAQNEGIRKIAGVFKTTPIDPLHNLLGILPISYLLPKLMHTYTLRLQGLPPNAKVHTILTSDQCQYWPDYVNPITNLS
jgi:hypothetical protein